MSRLQCHFLGPFQITLDGKPAPAFRFDKIRALLAYLVIESDLPHRREALAALLWPEEPDVVARQNLRQALYQLRQILGENPESGVFLLVTRQTAQFNPDSDNTCDLLQFRRLLADCDTHDHQQLERCEECIRRLREAADL